MKVLLIADSPNWAYDTIAKTVAKYSSEFGWNADVVYVKILRRKDSIIDLSDYDVVYWFLWYDAFSIGPRIKGFDFSKTCVGVHSHVAGEKRNLSLEDKRYILSQFSAIGVVSEKLKSELNLKNIIITPIGIDTDLFSLKKLKRRINGPLRLMWAGNPDASHHGDNKAYNSIITPVIDEYGSDQVILMSATPNNFIPIHKMMNFYSQGEILLCTSLTEGGPLPVLEAMYVGRPVISTDVGIVSEVVNYKNGWIIDRSRTSLRNAIDEALIKRSKLRKMGLNAHNDIRKNRDGRSMAKYMCKLFDICAEGGK